MKEGAESTNSAMHVLVVSMSAPGEGKANTWQGDLMRLLVH